MGTADKPNKPLPSMIQPGSVRGLWQEEGHIKENVNIHTWHFCKTQAMCRRNWVACCQASADLGQLKVKAKPLILKPGYT